MEWVSAARFHGYKTLEFLDLSVEDKVFLIAAYRVDNQSQAVIAYDRKHNPKDYE